MAEITYRPAGTITLSRALFWLGQTALNIWHAQKTWLMLKRAERKLHALDNRMLNDIGLDRSSIETAVREGNQAVKKPAKN